MIVEAAVPIPVEHLPTGDHALLMAWVQEGRDLPGAILCLEDGSAVSCFIDDFKFDYRWNDAQQQFIDVSGIAGEEEETEGAYADQASPDDGGEGVSGPVSEAD